MGKYELLAGLSAEVQNNIRRIEVIASAQRTVAEAAILTTYAVTVPTGYAGFAKGATFLKTDAANGVSAKYENTGTTSSAAWTLLATQPSHVVKYAGEFTTAGGDATESIPAVGALATDLVVVTLHTVGATPRTILTALAVADAITVTMSGDPSTDHVLTYVVLRAV